MKALFADLSERTRQHCEDRHVYKANERRQVIALCDAIQVAVAEGQQHQVSVLLRDMRAIVDTALARRRAPPLRIDV